MHQDSTSITLRACVKAQIIWEHAKLGWEEIDSNRTHVPCLKWGSAQAVQEWAASRQRLGYQPSPSHRHGVCIYLYHNPLSSQPGSKPYLYCSRSQVNQQVTFLGHQDHCSHSVWLLTTSALWSDSHSQTFLSSFWTFPVCFLLPVNI